MRALVRSLASVIAGVPGSRQMLRWAAVAPVSMKSRQFERLAIALAGRCGMGDALVETNAGIRSDLRVLLPPAKHQMLFGRPSNYVHERATLALAQFLSRRTRAFIDVGANEGLFSLAVACDTATQSGLSIHAFEPDVDVFARLQANLRRHFASVRVNNLAVSSHAGSATFYRNLLDDLSGTLLAADRSDGQQLVPVKINTISLAEYMKQHGITNAGVKIDVEGGAVDVWEGLSQSLGSVDWLICEMLGPEIEAKLPQRIMSTSGWYAYYIRDFDLVQSIDGHYRYRAPFYNWLFCAEPPERLADMLAQTRFKIIASPPHQQSDAGRGLER